jgi:hypothetical protein
MAMVAVLSPIKTDAPLEELEEHDLECAVLVEDCGLADDESGTPTVRRLLRQQLCNEASLRNKQRQIQRQNQQQQRQQESLQQTPLPAMKLTSAKQNPRRSNRNAKTSTSTPFTGKSTSKQYPHQQLKQSVSRPKDSASLMALLPPSEPNSPLPLPQSPPVSLSADPLLYSATNVAQNNNINWWTPTAFKSSVVTGFRGIGRLFSGTQTTTTTESAASVDPLSLMTTAATASSTSSSSTATTALTGKEVMVTTMSTPLARPRPSRGSPGRTPLPINNHNYNYLQYHNNNNISNNNEGEDELELEEAVLLSDSEFSSSDISESKTSDKFKSTTLHQHNHNHNRFTNRRLGSLLLQNLFSKNINFAAKPPPLGGGGGDDQRAPFHTNTCTHCGCDENSHYFGDAESGSSNNHSSSDTPQRVGMRPPLPQRRRGNSSRPDEEVVNIRVINADNGDEQALHFVVEDGNGSNVEGGGDLFQNEQQHNTIAEVLQHHLHERWFNADGRKVSSINLRFRLLHKSKASLLDIRQLLLRDATQGSTHLFDLDFV